MTEVKTPIKKQSKLKAVDPKAAEPSKPKILIFGKPGVGKTWTSLDFPNVYYVDTEGGADLDHYTDKLKKSGGLYLGPTQGSLSFDTIFEQIEALATEKHNFKTLVIDSISKIFNLEISKEATRLEKAGLVNAFGADKKPAIAHMRTLIKWITRLDMNVILISHEKMLWEKGEQVGTTFDCYEKLEYELHLCLQISKQGNSHLARVRKTRLLGFPEPSTFTWSYTEFATRYGKDIMEKEVVPLILATPEQLVEVNRLLDVVKIEPNDIEKWFTKAGVSKFEEFESDKLEKVIEHLKGRIK